MNRSAQVEMAFADLGSFRSVPVGYDNLIRLQFDCGQVGLCHVVLNECYADKERKATTREEREHSECHRPTFLERHQTHHNTQEKDSSPVDDGKVLPAH